MECILTGKRHCRSDKSPDGEHDYVTFDKSYMDDFLNEHQTCRYCGDYHLEITRVQRGIGGRKKEEEDG